MPMLNGCRWPGCDISSVHSYCSEHARLMRAEADAEREWATSCDEPMARERTALRTAATAPGP